MNAPLPEVPPPSSTKAKPEAPEGLRWIVALQIGLFLVLSAITWATQIFSVAWAQYEPLEIWMSLVLFLLYATLYCLLFFFLGRGANWARRLFIGVFVVFFISQIVWPDFLAPEEPLTRLEEVLDYPMSALWMWTLIYLFLPRVRAYFAAK